MQRSIQRMSIANDQHPLPFWQPGGNLSESKRYIEDYCFASDRAVRRARGSGDPSIGA